MLFFARHGTDGEGQLFPAAERPGLLQSVVHGSSSRSAVFGLLNEEMRFFRSFAIIVTGAVQRMSKEEPAFSFLKKAVLVPLSPAKNRQASQDEGFRPDVQGASREMYKAQICLISGALFVVYLALLELSA